MLSMRSWCVVSGLELGGRDLDELKIHVTLIQFSV